MMIFFCAARAITLPLMRRYAFLLALPMSLICRRAFCHADYAALLLRFRCHATSPLRVYATRHAAAAYAMLPARLSRLML